MTDEEKLQLDEEFGQIASRVWTSKIVIARHPKIAFAVGDSLPVLERSFGDAIRN
jgi:hypothetical protein